ncbi:transcription-repair coupling factor [Fusibacter tunisiensis]|uniref:Transcription-repair-coupling factor n=1 Tax=Fusibacter tunisiensis TaxID=1008308 RepID=A0ABS2MR78_9FIRM|nr:transcription-repair coupling factor [Fusibacter tunisiensis]MBM7561899.1 transcription-repair coupling factor (superfamily II helicase) [Fusibacter tunisiensis]
MNHKVLRLFQQSTEYETIYKAIEEHISPVLIHGSDFSAMKWVFHKLAKDFNRRVILCFEDDHKAKLASEDVLDAIYLPSREMVWFDAYAHSHQVSLARMEALLEMNQKENGVLYTAIHNLAYKYSSQDNWLNASIHMTMETVCSVETFVGDLFEFGYERVDIVESKGQYSVRGGIVDVFSPMCELPHRIEFFGDEVDSIRTFELASQKSIDKVQEASFYPVLEFLLTSTTVENTIQRLKGIQSRLKSDKQDKIDEIIEQFETRTYAENSDKYFSLIDPEGRFLADVLDNPIICLVSNNQTLTRLDQFSQDYSRQFTDYLERGEVVSEQFGRVFTFEEVLSFLKKRDVLLNELLMKRTAYFEPQQIIKMMSREMNKYYGKYDQVAQDILKWKIKGYRVLIALSSEERMARFLNAMQELDVVVNTEKEFDEILSGQALAVIASVQQGFYFDTFKAVLLTENELLGEGKRIAARKQSRGGVIKAFSELAVGDFVVHENHGVGQYVGVEQMKIDLTRKDFLKIRYAQNDFLYIPVESAGLIQKYHGTDQDKIKLNRLGGAEWKRTKSRAKKAIEDMTDELIELYAARKVKKGYAFSGDNEWQREFEALFPYQETNDQLKCIDEIKADMERDQPMERLLCGDVGYGKTEVALRAAFKAVLDSKQVAILVPTTILAQQHYTNIVERFSKYPANIQMISRFRTKAEQDKIIENIGKGIVDVVVGTHRILSKDVKFKDLGLLIVDEEQRFGVKHKEKIKQLKENIDVLTLSATPIPRTLHMSMIGIRDMSVIEDPPEDRYPIQTYVVSYDENLVREAIVRELERGGQVYFVHNRISDIDRVAAKLSELVPEAKVQFAHGQMNEHVLEKLMVDFMNNSFNVLVSTTIIETGMDISNVNTIIINDGDRFGLSQLYQLRGRVGRSNRIAYCYIFYQENKVLSEVAEKRLKAIKEFTELGAGFKIAMRDLEIRGTGNVLGTAQHGHMEAVGYDLYVKLLEESMLRKKGQVVKDRIQAKIDLTLNAYIPDRYIGNHQMKIEIYKKIAAIDSRSALDAVYEEVEDRFGTVPASVYNLMSIALIKSLCEEMTIEEVSEESGWFNLKFVEDAEISPLFISKVLEADSVNVKFLARNPAVLKIKITNKLRNKEQQLGMLEKFVETLYSFHSDYVNI